MTFAIAGAAALRRTVKPKPEPWSCECPSRDEAGDARPWPQQQPAYLSRCPDCGTRRPNT